MREFPTKHHAIAALVDAGANEGAAIDLAEEFFSKVEEGYPLQQAWNDAFDRLCRQSQKLRTQTIAVADQIIALRKAFRTERDQAVVSEDTTPDTNYRF